MQVTNCTGCAIYFAKFRGCIIFQTELLLLNIWGIRLHYSGDAYSIHDVVKLVSDFKFYTKKTIAHYDHIEFDSKFLQHSIHRNGPGIDIMIKMKNKEQDTQTLVRC